MSCELFFREGCHLCEDMINQLRELFPEMVFQLQNVDTNPQWFNDYNDKVPFLKCGDEILSQYFLEPDKIRKHFNGQYQAD